MAEESNPEEARVERLVERALERQLPLVLARLGPPRGEAGTDTHSATGGSKLNSRHTFSPFGDDELPYGAHILLLCGSWVGKLWVKIAG